MKNYSETSFQKVLKIRMASMVVWVIIGCVMLLQSAASENYDGRITAIAFIFAGAILLLRKFKQLRNPKLFKKAYTEYTDERNQFIIMKTYAATIAAFILVLAAGVIIFDCIFANETVRGTLSACIGVLAAIYFITYMIMKKRY